MRDPRLAELGDLYPFESHYLELSTSVSSSAQAVAEANGECASHTVVVGDDGLQASPLQAEGRHVRKASPLHKGGHRGVGVVRMHYVDEGHGPPLVLLHGNPTWSFYYRELVKGLRGKYRVVVPDHVGCGLSDKPQDDPYTLATHIDNFSRLMDALELTDVTLGVHDWGGPIGLGWAVRNPQRVRRMIIFNTAAFLDGVMPLRIRMCGWPVVGDIAVRRLNLFAKSALQMATARPQRFTPEVRRGYLLPYDSYADRVAILRFVQDIPFSAAVPSYSVFQEIERMLPVLADRPMTIFWGMKDFCFTPAFLDAWIARFPRAEVHRLPGCGHYVVEDGYEEILRLLNPIGPGRGSARPG